MADARPVACRPDTLDDEGRAEHGRLARELLAAASGIEELADGYAVRFPAKPFLFLRISRWIELERACCPFLTIRLDLERPVPGYRVSLTGPEGAKEVVRAELLRLPAASPA